MARVGEGEGFLAEVIGNERALAEGRRPGGIDFPCFHLADGAFVGDGSDVSEVDAQRSAGDDGGSRAVDRPMEAVVGIVALQDEGQLAIRAGKGALGDKRRPRGRSGQDGEQGDGGCGGGNEFMR